MHISNIIGAKGELIAAKWLKDNDYLLIDKNWKNGYCEIDIIALKNKEIYLIEVKTRTTDEQGYPEEYITERKLTQMQRSAEFWKNELEHEGQVYIAVMSIDLKNQIPDISYFAI